MERNLARAEAALLLRPHPPKRGAQPRPGRTFYESEKARRARS